MRNSRPSRPVGGHAPCKQSRLIAEAEIGATMERDAYLLHRAAAAIILEQFAKSRGRHELCRAEQYACLFDRPERTLGASGG